MLASTLSKTAPFDNKLVEIALAVKARIAPAQVT
jgi:hypothetical protein